MDPSTATVLLAEDHVDSRDALRALLEAYGFHVLVASNGREAVELALESNPDLVLMDMMMPVMDGFQATRALRAAEGFRQVPVIALTAMDGAQEPALAAGCDAFVAKPLDIRQFVGTLRDWLARAEPAAP
jgi:CheY-like chemotaxis protein